MKNGIELVLTVVVVVGLSWSVEAAAPPRLTAGSETSVQLTIDPPKSVRDIYLNIGELSGVKVLFDSRFQDQLVAVEIDAPSAAEAFDTVAKTADQFWMPIDKTTIVVAEDTPRNRRDLEPLVIQVFPLKYAELRDVDKVLRTMTEARRVAMVSELNAIVVRDTAPKMIVNEHLINLIDRPQGQVDFSVDVIAYHEPSERPVAPTRIPVESYRELRAENSFEVLAQGGVGVLGGKGGSLSVMVPPADQFDEPLTVEISARSAQVDGVAMTTVEAVIKSKPAGSLTASTKLTEGETWLIPWLHPNRTLDLVLAVTAVNIEPSQFDPADLEAYWVGTESKIAVPRP